MPILQSLKSVTKNTYEKFRSRSDCYVENKFHDSFDVLNNPTAAQEFSEYVDRVTGRNTQSAQQPQAPQQIQNINFYGNQQPGNVQVANAQMLPAFLNLVAHMDEQNTARYSEMLNTMYSANFHNQQEETKRIQEMTKALYDISGFGNSTNTAAIQALKESNESLRSLSNSTLTKMAGFLKGYNKNVELLDKALNIVGNYPAELNRVVSNIGERYQRDYNSVLKKLEKMEAAYNKSKIKYSPAIKKPSKGKRISNKQLMNKMDEVSQKIDELPKEIKKKEETGS